MVRTSGLSITHAELHVAEQRDLALDLVGQGALGAADQQVGLDSDLHQLAHRVLRRLGLEFAGGGDVRDEGEVHEQGVLASHVVAELPDCLEERQRLDVADRAADLDDHDVVLGRDAAHRRLDLVGDVRDHLHRGAQILAAPLLGDDVEVDAARGDVVRLRQRPVDEPLVVAEVEVGLGAVVGDEHLAVLEGRHRAGIDVDVRVELHHGNAQSAFHEQAAERRGRDALAERRDHASGDENEFRRVLACVR